MRPSVAAVAASKNACGTSSCFSSSRQISGQTTWDLRTRLIPERCEPQAMNFPPTRWLIFAFSPESDWCFGAADIDPVFLTSHGVPPMLVRVVPPLTPGFHVNRIAEATLPNEKTPDSASALKT